MVRQNRTRRDRPWRVHFGARSQAKAHALHPSVQPAAETGEVEVLRSITPNQFGFSCYSPLEPVSKLATQPDYFGANAALLNVRYAHVSVCRGKTPVSSLVPRCTSFHEPVLFSGWNRRWHKLLAELSGETTESALFGLQHLSLVLGEAMFDVVGALDHHAPEEDGELARQGDIGDHATASRIHAAVDATQSNVLAAGQSARHDTEHAPGAITLTFDRTLALTALVAARRESCPCGEVFFGGPLG